MRRLRTIVVLLVGSVAFAAAGYGTALRMASTTDGDHHPPTAPVTAPVELRRISSVVVVRGDARFADPVQVSLSVAAPVPVVTRTPIRVGDTVEAGEVLVEVAGRPVIALPGRLPPYRDLKEGDIGPDVEQLEQALRTLGPWSGTVDDTFDEATTEAVTDLYERLDYEPPGTGLPRGEVAFAPTLPRRLDRRIARLGTLLPRRPLLLSGTQLIVSVDLTAADTSVLRAGMEAEIELPGGAITGRLGPVRRTATGGRTDVRVPELGRAARRALRGANVKVTVPLGASDGKVLVVPLAALNTDADGAVRVIRQDDGGATTDVEVEVGLSSGGFAEVTARTGALAAGQRVVVGR